jgi:hypothetical protein
MKVHSIADLKRTETRELAYLALKAAGVLEGEPCNAELAKAVEKLARHYLERGHDPEVA